MLCHLDLANKGVKDHGPYLCADCHSAAGQALVAKKNQEMLAKLPNQEVPRLLRGQPNAALITPKLEDGQPVKAALMEPVAFDHMAHEKYHNDCRVCHHKGMQGCEECHTLGGSKDGGMVTLEQAMHSLKSQHSCVGCHTAKQASPNCAGCHNHISKSNKPEDANCKQCHLPGSLPGGGTLPREPGEIVQAAEGQSGRDHAQEPETEPRHLCRGRHPGEGGDQGAGEPVQAGGV